MTKGLNIREGKTLNVGEKVEVYYNLHKGGFSILSRDKNNPDKNKVVAYADFVTLANATFHINSNKLKQIIRDQRKTVYAVVRGYLVNTDPINNSHHRKGYCNPYKTGKFVDWETKEELGEAKEVHFYDKYFSYTTK
ncbi:hypothetical protein ACTWQB_17155 [Piscibacillus sp. B03]|uniref:hypothetical protein n=1 Tax=Piscibacillus sp. B03 TaxID=3457430 RepID=UPI003FCD74FA